MDQCWNWRYQNDWFQQWNEKSFQKQNIWYPHSKNWNQTKINRICTLINQRVGMVLELMNCFRIAFSSSFRFFSSAFLGFTFLFSSNIHLKSSRCCFSGIGSRALTTTGSATTVEDTVFSTVTGAATELNLAAISSFRGGSMSFFLVLKKR